MTNAATVADRRETSVAPPLENPTIAGPASSAAVGRWATPRGIREYPRRAPDAGTSRQVGRPPRRMRRRSITFGLVLLAYALALVQRPGEVVADTKVDLYVAPARFLSNVLSVWSPTTDLGHVFGAQYSGYAWPMAPWFALGDAIDVPTWIVHRLWLGTLLALAAVGIVRLLDALATARRGALHVAAGVLFIVNPYVTVYANRTSISLLSYAALPWLLLAVHRGLREPRGWRWPALFALVLASTGGGVNVAVTAWLLVGPALLVVYEVLWGGVAWRAARGVVARLIAVNVVAQLWWIIPVLIQGMAAPSFLPFSEQPGTIWSTTSIPESLRLMGFWTSYVGVGFGGVLRPFQGSAPALLFLLPVVLAGLAVPALSLSGFVVTRRWRYAPFFLVLTLAGVVIMSVGWPAGTPLRRVATGAYYEVQSIEFLRTTYKAGALVALGLAALGGAAFDAAWQRVGAQVPWRRVALTAVAAGAVALAAWPLVSGRALERQLAFDLPPAWRSVAADLDRRPDVQQGDGASRAAVRLRELGRHDRSHPPGADRPSRDHALDRPVLRPPGDRAAVDGRRAGHAGAPEAGAAAAAAGPARRRRPRRRGRRRPRPQRRGAGRRRHPRAARPGRADGRRAPLRTVGRRRVGRGTPHARRARAADHAQRAAHRRDRARAAAGGPGGRRRRRGWDRGAGGVRRAGSAPRAELRAGPRAGGHPRRRAPRRDGRHQRRQPAPGVPGLAPARAGRADAAGRGGHQRRRGDPGSLARRPGVGDRPAALGDRERHRARIAAGDAVPRAPAVRRASTATRRPRGSPTARWSVRATG